METSRLHPSMSAKRKAQERARAERRLREQAWRLGLSPGLLKAVMRSKKGMLG